MQNVRLELDIVISPFFKIKNSKNYSRAQNKWEVFWNKKSRLKVNVENSVSTANIEILKLVVIQVITSMCNKSHLFGALDVIKNIGYFTF